MHLDMAQPASASSKNTDALLKELDLVTTDEEVVDLSSFQYGEVIGSGLQSKELSSGKRNAQAVSMVDV